MFITILSKPCEPAFKESIVFKLLKSSFLGKIPFTTCHQTTIIIGDVWNIESDTLWMSPVFSILAVLNVTNDTFPKQWGP